MDLDGCVCALIRLGHANALYYPWSFFLAAMKAAGGKRV